MRVTPAAVIYFLLANTEFPRSVAHTLNEVEASAKRLPKHGDVVHSIEETRKFMSDMSLRQLAKESLHEGLDLLQTRFIAVHAQIAATWFPD